nr:unnamed protein product [Callosobruchus analis]
MSDIDTALNILENYGNVETIECSEFEELNQFFCENSNGLHFTVLHYNIRSLQAHFDEVCISISELNKYNNIAIIIFSETWNLKNIDCYNIKGFQIYYNEARYNKCDGVVMYVREDLLANINTRVINESTALECRFTFNEITYNIIGIYRPNPTDIKQFVDDFDLYLKSIPISDVSLVVGDMNIDIAREHEYNNLRYINMMQQNGYVSQINLPTRVEANSSTTIDHIFMKINKPKVSDSNNVNCTPFLLKNCITDHYPVLLNFSYLKKNNLLTYNNSMYEIKTINQNKLVNLLHNVRWETVFSESNPQSALDNFYNELCHHINVATDRVKINNKTKRLKPWMTAGILTSIRKRDKMKQNLIKDKDNLVAKHNYITYRNRLTNLIKSTKNEYFSNKFIEAGNNYKKKWDVISEVTEDDKKKKNEIKSICTDTALLDSPDSIACEFNNFFAEIGRKVTSHIDHKSVDNNISSKAAQITQSMFLAPVDNIELQQMIGSLKNGSSPGKDGLFIKTIKLVSKYIICPLVHIFNLCFKCAIIPRQFKESIIVPIHKSGDKNLMTNYRPIAIINVFGKLFEKCLNKRLCNFIDKHSIISPRQFGFRKGICTENSLQELITHILDNFQNEVKTVAVFLDLQKAFDTVSHTLLLNKLEKIGIRGEVLNLFRNYLTDRTQQVKIGTCLSSPMTTTIGVPQGTVLGPTFFLIYINDLLNCEFNCEIISYADDTVLICTGRSWEDAISNAELSLNYVKGWLDNNRLKLNTSKTKYMTFAPTKAGMPLSTRPLIINGSPYSIDRVESTRYLGIIIDHCLKWQCHAEMLCMRLRRIVHKFFILRHVLNTKTLLLVYHALVVSLLTYGISAWGAAYTNVLQSLQTTQNYILRTIFKVSSRTSCRFIYKENNLLNIKALYMLASLKYVHSAGNNLVNHVYDTRAKTNLFFTCTKVDKSVCQKCIKFDGIRLYNSIPLAYKKLTKYKFKKVITKYITENFADLMSIIA